MRRPRKRLFVIHIFFSIGNELSNLCEQAIRRGAEVADAAVVHELVERAIDPAQVHQLAQPGVVLAEELVLAEEVVLAVLRLMFRKKD